MKLNACLNLIRATKLRYRIAAIGAMVLGLGYLSLSMVRSDEPIRMVMTGKWVTLDIIEHNNLTSTLILYNQYEPLVTINETGALSPLGAKSWDISEDYKTIRFKIDTSRRFSDGSHLQALDYKRSWEQSLKHRALRSNSGPKGLAYLLQGYEDFDRLGHISGIEVQDPETLILKFKTSLRTVLYHLRTARFAAFKEVKGSYIGTGKYVIQEKSKEELLLTPNPFHKEADQLQKVSLISLERQAKVADLRSLGVEVLLYALGREINPKVLNNPELNVIQGREAFRVLLITNGLKGNFFQDRRLRQAFQHLVHQNIQQEQFGHPALNTIDPQPFIPFQNGRLSENESRKIIEEGAKYVQLLKKASRKNPIRIVYDSRLQWLFELLEKNQIAYSTGTEDLPDADFFGKFYGKNPQDFDVLLAGTSISIADPDDLYEVLGRTGAILSPAAYREPVGRILEEGRALLNLNRINQHYQNVSRTVLQEVPYVQLGFSKAVAIYRKDTRLSHNLKLRRNQAYVEVFQRR